MVDGSQKKPEFEARMRKNVQVVGNLFNLV